MDCSIMNCKAKPKVGIRRIEDEGRTVNYSIYCPVHANMILYRCQHNESETLEKVPITRLTLVDGSIQLQSAYDKQESPDNLIPNSKLCHLAQILIKTNTRYEKK